MITIDTDAGIVRESGPDGEKTWAMDTAEAFEAVSRAWLRAGWDTKYVYSFTWMGRPVIQLPDDMIRIQEVLYHLKPDVVVETGVAHGGSLVFYASLMTAYGKGRVIGVDVEIRPHNRAAIEAHEMFDLITLIEGDSIADDTVAQVGNLIAPDETVLVLLDARHTYDHVMAELAAYGALVTPGSYIVACDGIQQDLVGAPRSQPDWATNNPAKAARDFAAANPDFVLEEPGFPFNEGMTRSRVTYWPDAFLRKEARS